jgi:hypothetical protein
MFRPHAITVFSLLCLWPIAAGATSVEPKQDAEPPQAPHLIDRFKALAGEWSGEGLDDNSMPGAKVRYTVTAGGHAVEELLFAGSPHEMRTLYVRDGDEVVLVHFCASGNHPKMRGRLDAAGRVVFEFDGAVNFDPTKAGHMHDASFTFVGPDELRTRWQFWENGRPAEHVANMHFKRVDAETAASAKPAP